MSDQDTNMPGDPEVLEVDHPHAGIGSEGWSSPTTNALQDQFAKLVLKRNNLETDIEFAISPPALIGRFDPDIGPIDVDLASVPEGSYVSRKHARIICEDGNWKIEDLQSSNGTFLLRGADFERVEQADLEDGQEIALGNARMIFRITPRDDVLSADAQS